MSLDAWWLAYPLLGAFAGFIAGLFGVGGGLTDGEAIELVGTIRTLRQRGITVVWIEHIVHLLVQIAERLV